MSKYHGKTRRKINPPISLADVERFISDESMGKEKIERLGTPCRIHLHSRRKRLTDPDGISGKAVIDGIVLTGLLKSDSAECIKEVSFSQEKSKTNETVVEIYTLE